MDQKWAKMGMLGTFFQKVVGTLGFLGKSWSRNICKHKVNTISLRRRVLRPTNSAGNLFRAANLFSAGKFFRTGRTFRAGIAVSSGIPRSVRPDSGTHRARFPLAFPWLFPNVSLHVYPERAGIPKLEGGCHSSLGSSGDISIPHSGVRRGHRNVPHTSDSHYTNSPDSSGLHGPPNPDSTPLIYVLPATPTPHSERLSAPLLRTLGRYLPMSALYTTMCPN